MGEKFLKGWGRSRHQNLWCLTKHWFYYCIQWVARMFEIHEAVEGVSMKGPIEIEQSSNLINIKLIQNNLMIK